ncbi:MAG: hypothetical protein JO142_05285 [Burkholderiales bacterium]|nr:hypothetical protein [Burkholderiales bacterium]
MNPQEQFDAAVVIPTVLRPELKRAVESVFAQDLDGRIQILIGVDKVIGDAAVLDNLRARVPENMHITVVDPGYSTSARHGGIYSNYYSGALRTILSYLANSRYVAYLDDDNWYRQDHLRTLKQAMGGFPWAFSRRWFAHPQSNDGLVIDEWESVGPANGIYKDNFGGFVDTSCFMFDKLSCHMIFPFWSLAMFTAGDGEDRTVLKTLLENGIAGADSGVPSVYYTLDAKDGNHALRLEKMREMGINVDVLDFSAGGRLMAR